MQNELQRTPQWYADRLTMITASNFHKVMARHKRTGEPLVDYYNYMQEIIQEILTGIAVEVPDNEYMKWGRTYEPVAKLEYSMKTGNMIRDEGFVRLEGLPIGCSIDGAIIGQNGGVEFKCPWSTKNHLEVIKTNEVPERYKPQVHGQMWIKGWDFVDFVSYDPRIKTDARLHIIRVYKDEAYRTELATKLYEFAKLIRAEVERLGGTYATFTDKS